MALIELAGIDRSFLLGDTTVHALAGLTLQIDAGEYVAVMGPSGSGKSTLLNLLGLLDRPQAGTATVGEGGWPHVQHRGGPPGFLQAIDARTLAFADYGGNRQFVSVGNLIGQPKAARLAAAVTARAVIRVDPVRRWFDVDATYAVERGRGTAVALDLPVVRERVGYRSDASVSTGVARWVGFAWSRSNSTAPPRTSK